jgi:hypothetical protein
VVVFNIVFLFGLWQLQHAHADSAAKQSQQEECWRQLQQCSNDDQPLATYFLSLQNPHFSKDATAREKRTDTMRLLIRLTQSGVTPHMPVVTTSIDPGAVHDIINTWEWLQVREVILRNSLSFGTVELVHSVVLSRVSKQAGWQLICSILAAVAAHAASSSDTQQESMLQKL